MNKVDFDALPDGFPLESDATLGFMQTDYQTAIVALAKLAGADKVILNGMEDDGVNVTAGWILWDNEFLYFEGGVKSEKIVINEVKTSKANEDGTVVERYFVRTARFGTSATKEAFYTSFSRVSDHLNIQNLVYLAATCGIGAPNEDWVILQGLESHANGITAGTALYRNRVVAPISYNGGPVSTGSPIYLTNSGFWKPGPPDASDLKFEPYTSQRIDALMRRYTAKPGTVLFVVTAELEATHFDGTGLGKYGWLGFAKANGSNGTVNVTPIANLTAIQRI